ncbi:unnamed protein product [Pieris macdunnoughi]|uniref:Uncharacterized protein n=1 Tax=Pieris macdunnoughi TaxID=345717 RepID=A0A821V8G9_9NEOP|nr:unnamed protein product [Pieris macdunnoughi]
MKVREVNFEPSSRVEDISIGITFGLKNSSLEQSNEAHQYIDPVPFPHTDLEKLIMVGITEGKRSRGRLPIRWIDQVKDSSSSKLYTVIREARDRNRWKQIVLSKCFLAENT